jgi:hypothetical protein
MLILSIRGSIEKKEILFNFCFRGEERRGPHRPPHPPHHPAPLLVLLGFRRFLFGLGSVLSLNEVES